MSIDLVFIIVGIAFAGSALHSHRIEIGLVTLPMILTTVGYLIYRLGGELVPNEIEREVVNIIAEITLIVVLFADASTAKIKRLRHHVNIPVRMLLIGMPLTILLGWVVNYAINPHLGFAAALLLPAILTPTDAALGAAVVKSPNVPIHLREGINVESGLNDGLALPIVIIAAILFNNAIGLGAERNDANLWLFTLAQVTLGPLAGIIVGIAGAKIMDWGLRTGRMAHYATGVYFLMIAFIAYFTALLIGGNGFIAAFIGGLAFGNTLSTEDAFTEEFVESENQLLTMITFMIFGAIMVPQGLAHITWKTLMLVFFFLTVVRMLPIWISLAGTGLSNYEKLFLGWFGPRGLASIIFALFVIEDRTANPVVEEMVSCIVLTVVVSIFIHGLSAVPLANRFKPPVASNQPNKQTLH